MLKRNELVARLDSVLVSMNAKLDQRPTKDVVNKSFQKFNQMLTVKIDQNQIQSKQLYQENKIQIQELDKEVVFQNTKFLQYQEDLDSKLTIADGKRIWKHFQRFSEYDDLKDLYGKVIPEIAKFEEELI